MNAIMSAAMRATIDTAFEAPAATASITLVSVLSYNNSTNKQSFQLEEVRLNE